MSIKPIRSHELQAVMERRDCALMEAREELELHQLHQAVSECVDSLRARAIHTNDILMDEIADVLTLLAGRGR